MIGSLESIAPARRLAATLGLVAFGSLAFGLCVCAEAMEAVVPVCHPSESAPSPVALDPAPGCCCDDGTALPNATLDWRDSGTPRAPAVVATVGSDVLAGGSPGPAGHGVRLAWLAGASPPHSPPPSFVLPLRV